MPATDERAMDEAIVWQFRLASAVADDWVRFTQWLEQDPANALAYDDLTLAESEACEALSSRAYAREVPAPPIAALRKVPRRVVGGLALAAALVAAIGGPYLLRDDHTRYVVSTRPGEHRTIQLADGSRIDLDGGTRLGLDRVNTRVARLDVGEALFSVKHGVEAPFELEIGGSRIRDIGTVFDVARVEGRTEVAVVEGAVLYNPQSEAIALSAGDKLVDPDGPSPIQRSQVDRGTIAGWREGRLVFRNASLAEVAAAIGRTTGATISVDQAIAARPFTGVVMTDRDQDALFRKLGSLLDVQIGHDTGGWHLLPQASSAL